jgi:SAM-dependent methyltransferase
MTTNTLVPRTPSPVTAVLPDIVRAPVAAVRTRLCRVLFDRGNLDTSPIVSLEELGHAAPGRNGYGPSGWGVTRRLLHGRSIAQRDVFVDFGCGMGRVVCQVARRYPFGRVLGIEVVPQLAAVAVANVDANRHRLLCADVEVVVADALETPIPDDMTYAYLYNSFEGELFARFVDRLIASLDRAPRRLVLGYLNPRTREHLEETGRFRLVRFSRGLRRDIPNLTLAVYESAP